MAKQARLEVQEQIDIAAPKKRSSWWTQFSVLYQRQTKNAFRDRLTYGVAYPIVFYSFFLTYLTSVVWSKMLYLVS